MALMVASGVAPVPSIASEVSPTAWASLPASAATHRKVTMTIPAHSETMIRAEARIRLSPRAWSRARDGRKVAARVMATTIGPTTSGTRAASPTTRTSSAKPTSSRQLHWPSRSSQSGTPSTVDPSATSRSPRTSSSGSMVAATNPIVGTARIIPRTPANAAPIGRAMSTTAGWSVTVDRKIRVARTLPRTMYIATISANRMMAVWNPPAPYATSRSIAVVTNPPTYGMNAPNRTMTASGPANGTPSSVRNVKSATALIAAVIAVPRRYPPDCSIA